MDPADLKKIESLFDFVPESGYDGYESHFHPHPALRKWFTDISRVYLDTEPPILEHIFEKFIRLFPLQSSAKGADRTGHRVFVTLALRFFADVLGPDNRVAHDFAEVLGRVRKWEEATRAEGPDDETNLGPHFLRLLDEYQSFLRGENTSVPAYVDMPRPRLSGNTITRRLFWESSNLGREMMCDLVYPSSSERGPILFHFTGFLGGDGEAARKEYDRLRRESFDRITSIYEDLKASTGRNDFAFCLVPCFYEDKYPNFYLVRAVRFMIEEMLPRLDNTLGLGRTPEQRGISGSSLGGFYALNYAFQTEGFKYAAAHSTANAEEILKWLELKGAMGKPVCRITCGEEDAFFKRNRMMADKLNELDLEYEYIAHSGGHDETIDEQARQGWEWLVHQICPKD